MTEPINDVCGPCGGRCCSYTTMGIIYQHMEKGETLRSHLKSSNPDNLKRTDNGKAPAKMRFFMGLRNDGGRELLFHCEHRSSQGKCRIYANRPKMCREFKCPALLGKEKLGLFLLRTRPQENLKVGREVTEEVHEWVNG